MADPIIDPNALKAGLSQLQQATPQSNPVLNPYGTLGTTSDSNYLQGLTYDRNPDYIKAVNQGFFGSMGNALLQTGAGIPLEIAEGIGYLGIGDIVDKLNNEEQEFGNSFSNRMREINEQVRTEGAPVYTTPDDQGFKPWDYKWWATNAPSIASAISLMIPASGAVKGIGALGKAMGGLRAAKALGISTKALAAGETIGMAALSRHMEGMMEGVEGYDRLYQEAKAQGKSDDEATRIASQGASDIYNNNWPLIMTDIIQFGMAFKSFGNLSRIKSIQEATEKTIKNTTVSRLLSQAGLEAGEEGYQYIIGEEANRKALLENKLLKDDYSTYNDRLLKYVSDGDFWTSAFFGAIGGAAFDYAGSKMEGKALEKQKIIDDLQKSALEKSISVVKDDPIAFEKSSDVDLHKLIISGLEAGRVDKVEQMLNDLAETSKDNQETIGKVNDALSDLKYLEGIYNNIFKDPTKRGYATPDLIRFELANRAEVRTNKRLYNKLNDMQTQVLNNISTERNLNPSYVSLLKAETELDLISNEFKDKSPAEKDIQKSKIDSLKAQINLLRDTIKTNESIDDNTVTQRLNINKSLLNTVSLPKVLYDLKIDQSNKDYDKLQTSQGQQEVQDKIQKFKEQAATDEYNKLTEQITPSSSFNDLKPLKEAATQLGKQKEFTEAYNQKLLAIKQVAPKFSTSTPIISLSDRWRNNNLLAEHEATEISKIALKTGGLPDNSELTPESIGDLYDRNPAFASKLNDYFAKTDSLINVPLKQNINKQSIAENVESVQNTNDEAAPVKINPFKNNKSAWNLQGVQFEMTEGIPDINKPSISNVAKKINWEFLNQGKLPLDATLHFEYDFNDEWNKDHNTTNESLFELVYYIDRNTNNKQPSNRIVVGVLSSYSDTFNYETAEAKTQLKDLRNTLFNEVNNSGFKTGVITLPKTTKVSKVIGGRFWNTTQFKSPTDVLRQGQKLTLAIGRKYKQGDQTTVRLDTNGSDIQDRITYSQATAGAVYMLIEAPNGDILPYKLFTKKAKEFEGVVPSVINDIKLIKDTKTKEQKDIVLDIINNLVSIKDINYIGGQYIISTGDIENPIISQVSEEELPAFIGDLIVQVDVNKINTGTYNEDLSKQGFITTDLNPYTHFHSTKVAIEPVTQTKIETKVTGTIPNPSPQNTTVKIGNITPKIKGAGATSISFGEGPKTKLANLAWKEGYYLPINEAEVREWISKNIPQVPLNVVPNLIEVAKHGGVKAWGVFENNAITLYKGAMVGTEYHEAFHAVFNMFLQNKERDAILSEAATMYDLGELNKSINYKENKERYEQIKNKDYTDFLNTDEKQYKEKYYKSEAAIPTRAVFKQPINSDPYQSKRIPDSKRAKGKIAVQTVDVDLLAPSQLFIDKEYIPSKNNPEQSTLNIPTVTKIGNEYTVVDGHHRLIEDIAKGAEKVRVNVIFLNEEEYNRREITVRDNSEQQDIFLEEKLADDFARYIQQQEEFEGKLGYNIRTFFKKLWQFLKSIFTSDINIESLFFRINTGFYRNKPIYKSDSIRYKINTDPYKIQRNIKTLNYYFFQAINDYKNENSLGDLNDVEVIKQINPNVNDAIFTLYANVYNGIIEAKDRALAENKLDLVNELVDLLNQFIIVDDNGNVTGKGDYYMLALRDLNKYGIKISSDTVLSTAYDSQRDDKQYEIEEEKEALEGWQVSAVEQNGKDSLSFNVKKLLRQTTEYTNINGEFVETTDQYGFKNFINFDEVYNYLERNLADSFSTQEMMDKLYDLQYIRPELYGIVQKLENDSSLKSQFFTNFAKVYISQMQVIQRINRYKDYTGFVNSDVKFNVYNANRKNLFQLLVDDWNLNLITPTRNQVTNKDGEIDKNKANNYLNKYNEIISGIKKKRSVSLDDNVKISNILLNFGIDIAPEVLQNEFISRDVVIDRKIVSVKPYDNYINIVDGDKSIKTILTSIAGGVNPYKGENAETSSAINIARLVARNVDNLHQDTFINVEGKQVYSYLLPTFLNKKIAEFKTSEGREQYLSNWWFSRNKWLHDLNNNADLANQFNVVLLDGLLMENRQGTKYYDMTDQELDITDINMFDNNQSKIFAYYRLPILSDSPQAPYIRFKKYNQQEVVNALYDLALSEKDRINLANSTDITIKNWNDKKGNGKSFQFLPIFNDPTIDLGNEDDSKATIKKWLDDQLKVESTRLINEGILNKDGKFNKTVSVTTSRNNQFLADYFYNKVLANAMITQLFSVDLAFYKNYDDFQKRNGQIFKFTKMLDLDANWNGFTPEKSYNTVYLKDSIIKSELKDFVYNDLIKKGYEEEYARSVADAYDDVNQTDAQGYITLDRYKKIKIGLGEWTDKHEEAYNKAKKGKEFSDNENLLFQPIKPFYYSHELIPGTNIITPTQNKNSEVVLTPALAKKSKTLKSLLDHMENNAIDSAQFVSAVKAGEYGAVESTNLNEAVVHTLDNKYYGIQQETPEHHIDTENLFGSQLRKLIIADIPDNTKFGNYTKKELVDNYQKLITQNIIDSYNEVAEEFSDIRKIQKILLEQVIERNLGEYYENALEIVKDEQGREVFNIPLYHPIHAKRFESLLNSIIRNRVIKQKINGGNFVLMSNFGLSDQLKVVTNENGAVEYMEVMLPAWTKKMFPRKPNGEVDLESIKKEDSKILDLFGYRIPTEHKYSMKKLRVVGFTPDIMGGIAILPAETTKIAGEDFDIDKMYVMIPNIEEKNGRVQKVKYNLDNIKSLTKEQRDNAIIDIIQDIWSHPAMSDQILIPGGFDTLKNIASFSVNRILSLDEVANPILPNTQMEYFKRNTTGSQLIGIAANHNTNHAVLQYTDIKLTEPVKFNGEALTELNRQKALDDKLISRNVAEFLAAFVDNAKDPVAGDLNLNTFTFDTVAMIVRLGYDLKTAITFITQPAIQAYSDTYFREGATRDAEKRAFDKTRSDLLKGKDIIEEVPDQLRIDSLLITTEKDLTKLQTQEATQQLGVLHLFKKYKEQADSLGKIVRATKVDTLGTRKTIAGNLAALKDIERAQVDKNLLNVPEIFQGNIYPLVKVSTEYGLKKPQEELLSKYFPYGNIAYSKLYDNLSNNKRRELTEDEINYINNLTLIYYTSGFGFFDNKEKSAFVNKFPDKFLIYKDDAQLNKFELMKYLRYIPKTEDNVIPKIEFVSGATISNEQREILTRSWEAMLNSDNQKVQTLAKNLVKYSFFTNGLSFTYAGFSHLIPTTYLDKLVDDQGINFRDYLYKLEQDSLNENLFKDFTDQLYRHDLSYGSLLPKLEESDIINKKFKSGLVTSIIVKKESIITDNEGNVTSNYFKFYSNGLNTYRFSGITNTGDYVFNIIEKLGTNGIFEYNIIGNLRTVIANNKLPNFNENDFYKVNEELGTGQEFYQLNSTRDLEIKYGIVDKNGKYKSYGKDGKGASSTKAYRKLLEDLAKINKDLTGTGYKAVYGKQSDGLGNINWIARIVDEFAQISSEGLAPNEQLNDLLRQRMNEVGVKVEYYDDLGQRLGNDVVALADVSTKLIRISKKLETVDTLSEEVGHMAEAFNRGSATHSRLMELIGNTLTFQQVVNEYGEVYQNNIDKLKKEAIGKLIGDAIIKKNIKPNPTILTFLQKLWNDFIAIFRNRNEITLQQEIEDIVGKIAEDVLEGNLTNLSESIKLDGVFYQLTSTKENEAKSLLEKGIDATYKKIKIYESKALSTFTQQEQKILTKLNDDLNKGLYQRGLLDYTINAKRELRRVVNRYENMNKNPQTLDEKRATIKALGQINNYVNGFRETLNGIAASDTFKGSTAEMKNVSRFVSETAELVNKLQTEYYKIGKPILAEILSEFSTNPNKDIKAALDTLEKDISWTQRWLDQLAEADDSILNILDVMVKDAKQRSRLKTLDISKELLKLQKELESKGSPSTSFMFERDFEGNLTGRVVTKYNIGEFEKQRKEFFAQNPKPTQANFGDKKSFDKAYKVWKIKVGAWFDENTQPHPNREEIIANKKVQFSKEFSNPKLATEKFNEWYGNNVIQSTYFDPITGGYLASNKYIKELAIPAEKYRSEVYKNIQANSTMQKYYDTIIKYLNTVDNTVPDQYKLNGYAPQVRKDFWERLYIEDKDGKKRLKDLSGIGKETKTSLAEQFIKHENDIEFGLTDENNQPINFLPIYFTRRISDTRNLSLDMTSSVIAMIYSVNDFTEMDKIVDTLEFAKDVVGERKVKTGTFDPVTMFKQVDPNGKPIVKQGKDSLAYQRLEDWMKMTVYGQQSKNEGEVLGIDKGKLADFVNFYTSLSSLALNIYSGVSNLTVGNAMVRMEAIASEFVTNKDLLKADKIYATELPGVIANIGQRLESNKLSLWLEYFDVQQNYDREYRNIDAGRNTVFSRLMKTSSLYFVNHAGEHYLQSRLSLALANNTKVKDLLGNEMTLWDAFEVQEDKLVLKPNLVKVGGSKSTSLFKKEEDGQPLTERDIVRFINRQNFVNKRLHGIYNNVDKSAIQQYALGRLAIMFRKFIKPGWNRRFAKLTYNEEGEAFTEGYYTTLGRFAKNIFNELKEAKFSIGKEWNNLNDAEKANIYRVMTEWAYLIAAITAASVLSQFADDDEDNYALNFAAYEAYRMYSEMRFFTSPTEAVRLLKSPAPAMYTIDKLAKFMQVWNWGKEVERGKYEGLNRFEVGSLQLLPFGNTYFNFRTPEEQLRFYSNNGVSVF